LTSVTIGRVMERPTPTADTLSTVRREAKRHRIGERQIRRAIADGELAVYQIGGWPRLKPSDVDRWIETRRRGGPGAA